MSEIRQESLLPGTHAIRKGELEITPRKGGWLVRYKNLEGSVQQRQYKTRDEAWGFYQECWTDLKKQLNHG